MAGTNGNVGNVEKPQICARGRRGQRRQDQQHQSLLSLAPSLFCRLACETATAKLGSMWLSLRAATVRRYVGENWSSNAVVRTLFLYTGHFAQCLQGLCIPSSTRDMMKHVFRAITGESTDTSDFNRDAHHAPRDTEATARTFAACLPSSQGLSAMCTSRGTSEQNSPLSRMIDVQMVPADEVKPSL